MKVVIQRVSKASVRINEDTVAKIGKGLMILLGVANRDTQEDINWLSKKIASLRIFSDDNGLMNKSIVNIGGDVIVVSQFTLHSNTKKGARPSFIKAAKPDVAIPLYEKFVSQLENDMGKPIQTGRFGADMKVDLVNDGPVTIVIDTENKE